MARSILAVDLLWQFMKLFFGAFSLFLFFSFLSYIVYCGVYVEGAALAPLDAASLFITHNLAQVALRCFYVFAVFVGACGVFGVRCFGCVRCLG